jgi:hypothetical protein
MLTFLAGCTKGKPSDDLVKQLVSHSLLKSGIKYSNSKLSGINVLDISFQCKLTKGLHGRRMTKPIFGYKVKYEEIIAGKGSSAEKTRYFLVVHNANDTWEASPPSKLSYVKCF